MVYWRKLARPGDPYLGFMGQLGERERPSVDDTRAHLAPHRSGGDCFRRFYPIAYYGEATRGRDGDDRARHIAF